jgi:hypothetical protein
VNPNPNDGAVSVCIPAYEAAAFIERTLDHAQAQTHGDLRILVAVDRSTDATEEICRERARHDDRIDVVAHLEQQGWVGNVNSLLDRVETEFAFVYFHDDLIEPTYSTRLAGALRSDPEATSAHCDVRLFDREDEWFRAGRAYAGPAVPRLLTYLVVPDRGSMMRSMVRAASPTGRLRMTPAGSAYEMALVAAGPVVRVPEVLYHREHQRPTGLGDAHRRRPFSAALDGLRWNIRLAADVIAGIDTDPTGSELLRFGLRVFAESRLRGIEAGYGATTPTPIEQLIPDAGPLRVPAGVATLDDELRTACDRAVDRLRRLAAGSATHVDP